MGSNILLSTNISPSGSEAHCLEKEDYETFIIPKLKALPQTQKLLCETGDEFREYGVSSAKTCFVS